VGTYDYNGQSPSPSLTLGCAFRFLFLFGLASFFGILRCPRITSDSVEHTSDLYYTRARLICSGILRNLGSGQNPEGRTLESTAYCATCNKHTAGRLKNHKKKPMSMMAFCCCCALLQAATPCCRVAVLPCCRAAVLPCCRAAVLPCCRAAVLLCCRGIVLPPLRHCLSRGSSK